MEPSNLLFDQNMQLPLELDDGSANVVVFSRKCELSENNQDSIGVFNAGKEGVVLALADGAGGHKSGAEASKLLIQELSTRSKNFKYSSKSRLEIIEGIEKANFDMLDNLPGSASTVVVAEVNDDSARIYFAGDSIALVIGGRGKLKYRAYGHNPVDMGIQAGILDEGTYDEQGLRHYVTNIVGSKQLHIECSVPISLDPRDTILICSDGLYDNIKVEEICEIVSDKDIKEAAKALFELAEERMKSDKSEFSKHDDLSFVLYQKK
jgi:protein phosphatase